MKRAFSLFLIMFIGVCFLVSSATSLKLNQGAQITTVGDGTAYIGTRQIDPATNKIVSESWSPAKPSTNWEFRIYIVASGYGELVLSLLGQSVDYDIGDWRNGPSLDPADNEVFQLKVNTLSPAYKFPMILLDSPPHAPLNEGYANEINTGSFTRSVSGSAVARGRKVTEYGDTTVGLNVGVNMTGPNAAIVIGSSENWRWSAGPSHPQQDVSRTATMSVSVSDSQSSSSNTQSGSPSGTPDGSNTNSGSGTGSNICPKCGKPH